MSVDSRFLTSATYIENPDVILIGSGVMSANLGAMLKLLEPRLSIQLYEVTDGLAQESSDGWNNAGTGHAGICELSYTPKREADGSVNVSKVIEIFEQYEHSKQFWSYAVATGIVDNPKEFINPIPHLSFVHGDEQVDFLRARHSAMSAHHFFQGMEYSTDRATIASWAPLLLEGRSEVPITATKMNRGTDVNFARSRDSSCTGLDSRKVAASLPGIAWSVCEKQTLDGKCVPSIWQRAKFART